MEKSSSLNVLAGLKDLSAIRRFTEETAAAWGADPLALYDVIQAIDEAATNIIVHGYQGQPGMIEIEISREESDLRVCLRDQAPQFNPALAPPPDLTLPLEKRPFGGMGIFLIRKFMDEMIYEALPSGGNELVLVKHAIFRRREEEAADEHYH